MSTEGLFQTNWASDISGLDAQLVSTRGLVCLAIGVEWSPSSRDLLKAVKEVEQSNEIPVVCSRISFFPA